MVSVIACYKKRLYAKTATKALLRISREKTIRNMAGLQKFAKSVGWGYLTLSTGLFSGFAPVASGTFGTMVGIPLYIGLMKLGAFLPAGWMQWVPYGVISLILFLLGIQGANRIEEASQEQDHGIIVIDEIVGYLITMAFLPFNWQWITAGFFVFRFFDILKPYPIRSLDENPNLKGFGVMIDDALAGVYGNLLLQAAKFLIERFA